MNSTAPPYNINGEEPLLAGQRCTGLVVQQLYEGRQITDQVNVAYLRFSEQWYWLYFECATIFWRKSEAPTAPENSGLAHGLLLNDLSGMETVVGQSVEAVTYRASISGDVWASIRFTNGKSLEFAHSCEGDSTQLVDMRCEA